MLEGTVLWATCHSGIGSPNGEVVLVSFSLSFLFSVAPQERRKRRLSRPLRGSRRRLYGFLTSTMDNGELSLCRCSPRRNGDFSLSLSLCALFDETAIPLPLGGSRRGRKTVNSQSVVISLSWWLSETRLFFQGNRKVKRIFDSFNHACF